MRATTAIGRPEAVSPVATRLARDPHVDQADFAARLRDARATAQAEDGLATAVRADAGRVEAARTDAARDADLRAASRRQWALQAERAPSGSANASARQPVEPAGDATGAPGAAPRPDADRPAAEQRASARLAASRPQPPDAPRRDDGSARTAAAVPTEAQAAPAPAQADAARESDEPDRQPADEPPDTRPPLPAAARPEAADPVGPGLDAREPSAMQDAPEEGVPAGQAGTSLPGRAPGGTGPDGKPAEGIASASRTLARPGTSPPGEAAASTVGLAAQRAAEPATRGGSAPASFASALAAMQQAAAPAGGTPAGVPTAPEPIYAVREPVGTAAFGPALSERVIALAIDGLDSAQVTVSPPELGPVRIELSLSGESAAVAFSALQPETRRAIEQSLPVLRDMLAEHGMKLADARVDIGSGAFAGHGDPHRPGHGAPGSPAASRLSGPQATGTDGIAPARAAPRLSGRLDLFA